MEYKASLTRGPPVGSPAGNEAYVFDEGMPCGTTIAIWAGLLLGALGTGFGAAGYAFSMENKDKIAEMHVSPPPAPSLNLGNLACAEQIFGGVNTPKSTLYPAGAGDSAPLYYYPTTGSAAISVPDIGLAQVVSNPPTISVASHVNTLTSIYTYVWSAQTFSPAPATQSMSSHTLCSSVVDTGESCPDANIYGTVSSYALVGSASASGNGALLWDVTGQAPGTSKAISGFTARESFGYGTTSLATVKLLYTLTNVPGVLGTTGNPGSFTTLTLEVPHKMYVTAKSIGGTMHVFVEYVPTNDYAQVIAKNDATILDGTNGGSYAIGETALYELQGAFLMKLKTFYYSHTVNAQCASV